MSRDRVVLCGEAAAAGSQGPAQALRLRMWGPRANIDFGFEDVQRGLWGCPPAPFLDLLDIATYVYCADQAVPRGGPCDEGVGERWRRRLHFTVPVRRPELWSSAAMGAALVEALSFLTEDEYDFRFVPMNGPVPVDRYIPLTRGHFRGSIDEVLLFSGGLDSLAGAAQRAVAEQRQVLLLNHRPNPKLEPVVRELASCLARQAPGGPPVLVQVRINKSRGLSAEPTQRSRSFLFAALGATAAEMLGLPHFSFYENGITSLNLPPCAQVVGARASRTTHPQALLALGQLFTLLADRPLAVRSPFLWHTKTDVVRTLEAAGCAGLIQRSRSCACVRGSSTGVPHCGLCSQCIDRRFAVLAAGLGDHDPAASYAVDLLTGPRPAGQAQAMLAAYAEMASHVEQMNAAEFFRRFGEASRALSCVGEVPDVAARKVFELYKQHARAVCRVMDEGLARHAAELRRGELPETCLLRMVWCGEQAPAPAAPVLAENAFRRCGQVWQVRFAGGEPFLLTPSVGAAYLHMLLQRPGRQLSAVEMAYRVAKSPEQFAIGGGSPALDDEGRAAYRAKLAELKGDMAQAEADNDHLVLAELRQEHDAIVADLSRRSGLGGRARRENDPHERVRKSVYMALARVVRQIKDYDQALAQHLSRPRLSRGAHPSYCPGDGLEWET